MDDCSVLQAVKNDFTGDFTPTRLDPLHCKKLPDSIHVMGEAFFLFVECILKLTLTIPAFECRYDAIHAFLLLL